MALFGIGKKKAEAPAPQGYDSQPDRVASRPVSPGGVPTEEVMAMQHQGMNQNQIVQNLNQKGYNSSQVFDAMNQAAAKGGAGAQSSVPAGPAGQMPPVPYPGQSAPPPPPPPRGGGDLSQDGGGERFEEIAESIVEEKFEEFVEELKKVKSAQEANSESITKIQQAVTDLKSGMDNLHKAIVGKIGEYDQNLLSVGTEIKAMEKVFSKVLPTFTENVNELARVAKKMRPKN